MVRIKLSYVNSDGEPIEVPEDVPIVIDLPEVTSARNITHEQILTIILAELLDCMEDLNDDTQVVMELYDDSPTIH